MKDAGLRLRVEKQLRKEFVGACHLQGKHAADVLRTFMREYVAREAGGMQTSLFQAQTQVEDAGLTLAGTKSGGRKKAWARRS
jgi:hypothetical protein